MKQRLKEPIEHHTAVAGMTGLGYLGLPLAVEMARSGFRVVGLDPNARVVERIDAGGSYILDVPVR